MIQNKYTQSTLNTTFDFGNSTDFATIPETAVTLTGDAFFQNSETGFTLNPDYRCRCRRGYSLYNDSFNNFRMQREPADYSRSDLKRAYRLGGAF